MHRVTLPVALAAAALVLVGCSSGSSSGDGTQVIAPVVMDVNDLEGETVDLVVGQALDITTGSLAVDSYSGEVADTAVAEFVPGREDGSATYNPGVTAVGPGTTQVTLSNSDGGIQDVVFTVDVTE